MNYKVTIVYEIVSDNELNEDEILSCLRLVDEVGSERELEVADRGKVVVRLESLEWQEQ